MVKPVYINGLSAISAQNTFASGPLPGSFEHAVTSRFKATEPAYKEFIPPDQIRRMGRIIKMGVAAAKLTLQDADLESPDAIITGTGLGCLEDTDKFLTNMIRNKEEFLTPTSFIQSTHNTVGAQIALLIKCHGYNFTYCHRGTSFESALTDSMLQIQMERADSVLAGGIDEMTDNAFTIMNRMGHWKQRPVSTGDLYASDTRGTIAGEGASFFLLESGMKNKTYARITGVSTLQGPSSALEVKEKLDQFLVKNNVEANQISLFMNGMNGDPTQDMFIREVTDGFGGAVPMGRFKHLCGEYHTSTGFATWLSAKMIHEQKIPNGIMEGDMPGRLNHILIYNTYRGINHSFLLLSHP